MFTGVRNFDPILAPPPPVHQESQQALEAAERSKAALRRRLAEFQRRVAELEEELPARTQAGAGGWGGVGGWGRRVGVRGWG